MLLGPSGSGKSTLLNILGGLDVPSEGTLQFGAQRLDGAGEAALTAYRREHVGFVFQFYNLIPSLTVRENVALVAEIARDPMPVDDAVVKVGLSERAVTVSRGSRAASSSARPLRGRRQTASVLVCISPRSCQIARNSLQPHCQPPEAADGCHRCWRLTAFVCAVDAS